MLISFEIPPGTALPVAAAPSAAAALPGALAGVGGFWPAGRRRLSLIYRATHHFYLCTRREAQGNSQCSSVQSLVSQPARWCNSLTDAHQKNSEGICKGIRPSSTIRKLTDSARSGFAIVTRSRCAVIGGTREHVTMTHLATGPRRPAAQEAEAPQKILCEPSTSFMLMLSRVAVLQRESAEVIYTQVQSRKMV